MFTPAETNSFDNVECVFFGSDVLENNCNYLW